MKGRNQLLKGMRGSFENMTVTQAADGDAIISGKITQTTNPNTDSQQHTRSLFTQAVRLGRTLLAFVQTYYPATGALLSSFNQFVKNCMAHRDELSATIQSLSPSEIVEEILKRIPATTGRLYPITTAVPDPGTWSADTGGYVVMASWTFDPDSPIQNGSDKIGALVVNSETLDYKIMADIATRTDGYVNILLETPDVGTNYLAVFGYDESKVRNGVYPIDAITTSDFVASMDSANVQASKANGWTEVPAA